MHCFLLSHTWCTVFFIKLEIGNGNFPSSEKKGKYDVRIKAIKFDSGMNTVKDLEIFQDLDCYSKSLSILMNGRFLY